VTPDDVRDWAKRNHAIVSVGTVYLTVGERQAVIVASGGNLLAITPHETGAGLYRLARFYRMRGYKVVSLKNGWPGDMFFVKGAHFTIHIERVEVEDRLWVML